MKKILAFILATFMVLSLVPASSFAAFDVACPSTHTMVNCETKYITTVPATCTAYGYDIYNCVKCGAEILDNFVKPVEHTFPAAANSKHVNKAATCTTPGYEWVKKCSVCSSTEGLVACDKSCGDKSCKLYKKVIEVKHNYVATGSGIGCEAEYKCSLCGDIAYKTADGKFVASASHDWDYAKAEVITAPSWTNGAFVKGEAVVKCSVKGCPAEKNVEITSMACQHYAATIVKAYADATCFAAGSLQVIECRDCKVYFVDDNKNGEIDDEEETLKDSKGKATKDLANAVIKQLEHEANDDGYEIKNCVAVYTCKHCKTVQSKVNHTGIKADDVVEYPATCLNPGYDFKYCTACNQNLTITLAPTNHKDTTVTFEVTPSCANVGAKYTICTSPTCTSPKSYIYDAHKDAAAKVPADSHITGAVFGYYVRVIKTENVKAIDASEHTLVYKDVTNGTPIVSDEMPTTTCAGYKIVEITCAFGCTNTVEFVPAGSHDEYVAKKYANCNLSAPDSTGVMLPQFTERVVYACKNCSMTRYEDIPVSFNTQYATEADLNYYHGEIYYYADASTSYKLVSKTRLGDVVISLNTNLILPTCTTEGLKTYACTKCNTNYYVTDAKVDHTPVKGRAPIDTDYVGGEAATCTKAGKWDSFKCAHCSNTIIYNNYTKEQEIVTDLTIKAHGSTLTKVTPKSDADTCVVSYWQCTCGKTFTNWDAKTAFDTSVENHTWVTLQAKTVATCNKNGKYEIKYCSNKNCRRIEVNAWFEVEGKVYEINIYNGTRSYSSNKYKDTKISNKIATLDSKGKWANKTFTIKANGKLSGDYGVALPMLDHKAPLAGSSIESKVPAELIAATNFTSEKRNASGDHTTPGYVSMQCNYCSYEYFTDYVAASKDHVNVNGQVIPADCTNSTIKDRFCIFCNAVVAGNHEYTTTEPMTAPATCVQSGYEYKLCKLCGYRDMVKVIAPSDDFHTSEAFEDYKVEIGKQSNYAQVGTEYSVSCALCKKNIGEAQKPEDIKTAGFEILLDADAKTFIPGSTVKVTVSLASLQGVSVWAIAFPVTYDAEVFEFVGYEWNTAESAFQTFAVTEVAGGYEETFIPGAGASFGPITDGIFQPAGLLSIVANADAGTLVKEEELLVTLEFKVISADATTAVFTVEDQTRTIGGVIGKTLLEVYGDQTDDFTGEKLKDDPMWVERFGKLYQLLNAGTEKTFNVEALDEYGKAVAVNYNDKNSTDVLEVAAFLDLTPDNNNDDITLADAYALYSLIYNNEYDVKADANFDGKVDGKDLSILYAVYSGVITVEQLIAPNAELPEDWYAGLGGR